VTLLVPTLLPILLAVAAATAPAGADSAAAPRPLRLEAVATLAGTGDGRGEVIDPAGLVVDAFGRVYVADAGLHRMQRLGADGRWLGEAGTLGSGPGELRRPGSVALLGALGVAVLDRENRRVATYDLFGRSTGILIDLAADGLLDAVGRIDPVGMASDRGGAVYVTDGDRDRILVFDFSGRYLRALGGFGPQPGSFEGLSGIAVAPRGQIVVAERANRRVQILDAGGRPVSAWPLEISATAGPLAVAVDDSGRVAVADARGGRIWLFTADGRELARAGGFETPQALAFGPGGDLFVAENGRVRRFAVRRNRGRSPAAQE
jgi:DNA-binding beta-propeller fold protein YncE